MAIACIAARRFAIQAQIVQSLALAERTVNKMPSGFFVGASPFCVRPVSPAYAWAVTANDAVKLPDSEAWQSG